MGYRDEFSSHWSNDRNNTNSTNSKSWTDMKTINTILLTLYILACCLVFIANLNEPIPQAITAIWIVIGAYAGSKDIIRDFE